MSPKDKSDNDISSAFNLELVNPRLELDNINPHAPISPGQCYFVRWMNGVGETPHSWIGVICAEDMLPAWFCETRPDENVEIARPVEAMLRDRKYPVWLIGKENNFRWIKTEFIFHLSESIRDTYKFSQEWDDFSAAYIITQERPSLDFWRQLLTDKYIYLDERESESNRAKDISADTREDVIFLGSRKRPRISLFGSKDSSEEDDFCEGIAERRKRFKVTITNPGNRKDSSPTMSAGSNTIGQENSGSTQYTKLNATAPLRVEENEPWKITEPEDPSIHVAIYVGPESTKFVVPRWSFACSKYLTSLLVVHPNQKSLPFIMNPDLASINVEDFRVVAEFLINSDYHPQYICIEGPDGQDKWVLEGVTKVTGFTEELRRCGMLYCLSKRLKLPSLENMVMMKVEVAMKKSTLKGKLDLADYLATHLGDRLSISSKQDQLHVMMVKWLANNLPQAALSETAALWNLLEKYQNLQRLIFLEKAWMVLEEQKGNRVVGLVLEDKNGTRKTAPVNDENSESDDDKEEANEVKGKDAEAQANAD